MDKYDFQEVLKANAFGYYQGGGIFHKGSGGRVIGSYTTSFTSREITNVFTDNSKLKTICLLHGVITTGLTSV